MIKFCPNCGFDIAKVSSEDRTPPQNASGEAVASENTQNSRILDDYYSKSGVAQPKVYDWKKELDKKRATLAKNQVLQSLPKQDGELAKFGSLIIGEGLQQTF